VNHHYIVLKIVNFTNFDYMTTPVAVFEATIW